MPHAYTTVARGMPVSGYSTLGRLVWPAGLSAIYDSVEIITTIAPVYFEEGDHHV